MNNLYFNGSIKDINKYLKLIEMLGQRNLLVASDIDNTICNTNYSLAQHGYDTSTFPVKGLSEEFWLSKEGNMVLYDAQPMKPMLKLLKSLEMAGGKIIFNTQRNQFLSNLTTSWFRRNHIYTSDIMFVEKKLWTCADVYIEDDPREIEKLIARKKIVLVPTWEYNKDMDDTNIIHVYFNKFEAGKEDVNYYVSAGRL